MDPAALLKNWREDKGLTRAALAERATATGLVKLTESTIYKIEDSRRKMSAVEMYALAEALGITLDEFAGVLRPTQALNQDAMDLALVAFNNAGGNRDDELTAAASVAVVGQLYRLAEKRLAKDEPKQAISDALIAHANAFIEYEKLDS